MSRHLESLRGKCVSAWMKLKYWCPLKITPFVMMLQRFHVVGHMDEDHMATLNVLLDVCKTFNLFIVVIFHICKTFSLLVFMQFPTSVL